MRTPITACTRVVNLNREPYDVRIDRQTKWGNPFREGADGTRRDVIRLHARWLLTQFDLLADLRELRGRALG